MILVMAYATLIGACVVVAARALQSFAGRILPTRWLWFAALAALVVASLAAIVVPRAPGSAQGAFPLDVVPIASALAFTPPAGGSWSVFDRMAVAGWAIVTLTLSGAITIGAVRVSRARRRAERIDLRGAAVLVTDSVGPAVTGIARPVVLVPRWVLGLDEPMQRLLIAHEEEHANAGDSRLVWFATLATVLLPWNPAVWWLARRLRLAIEIDCDRRVLRQAPDVRAYAELLLLAARRRASSSFLSLAHLRAGRSDLRKRIDAMTIPRTPFTGARLLLSGLVALGAIVLACEAPRPDPVAPLPTAGPPAEGARLVGSVEVDKSKSDDEYLRMRLTIDSLRLAVSKLTADQTYIETAKSMKEVEVRDENRSDVVTKVLATAANVVLRTPDPELEIPATDIVVVSSDGKELYARRVPAQRSRVASGRISRSALDVVSPEDIASVEVVKGRACRVGGESSRCALLSIQLKPGAKLLDRAR